MLIFVAQSTSICTHMFCRLRHNDAMHRRIKGKREVVVKSRGRDSIVYADEDTLTHIHTNNICNDLYTICKVPFLPRYVYLTILQATYVANALASVKPRRRSFIVIHRIILDKPVTTDYICIIIPAETKRRHQTRVEAVTNWQSTVLNAKWPTDLKTTVTENGNFFAFLKKQLATLSNFF